MSIGDTEDKVAQTEIEKEDIKSSEVISAVDDLVSADIEQLKDLSPEQQQELYEQLKKGLTALDQIAIRLEKSKIADYADMMGHPKMVMYRNFIGGIARGVGFSFGFSILVGLIIYFLTLLVDLDLPVIGNFIASLLDYVDAVRSFH